jgi:hypothetical protein
MRVGEFRLGLLLSVASSRSGAASHATSIMSFRAGSLSWMRLEARNRAPFRRPVKMIKGEPDRIRASLQHDGEAFSR